SRNARPAPPDARAGRCCRSAAAPRDPASPAAPRAAAGAPPSRAATRTGRDGVPAGRRRRLPTATARPRGPASAPRRRTPRSPGFRVPLAQRPLPSAPLLLGDDVDGDLGDHFGVQFDPHRVLAHRLDAALEIDAAAVDGETLGLQGL